MAPFYRWRLTVWRLQSYLEETVCFLPLRNRVEMLLIFYKMHSDLVKGAAFMKGFVKNIKR